MPGSYLASSTWQRQQVLSAAASRRPMPWASNAALKRWASLCGVMMLSHGLLGRENSFEPLGGRVDVVVQLDGAPGRRPICWRSSGESSRVAIWVSMPATSPGSVRNPLTPWLNDSRDVLPPSCSPPADRRPSPPKTRTLMFARSPSAWGPHGRGQPEDLRVVQRLDDGLATVLPGEMDVLASPNDPAARSGTPGAVHHHRPDS